MYFSWHSLRTIRNCHSVLLRAFWSSTNSVFSEQQPKAEQTNITAYCILQTEEKSTDHSLKVLEMYCYCKIRITIVDNYPYHSKLCQCCDSENTDLHNIHHCTAEDCSTTYKPTEDFQKDWAENNKWKALLKY